MQEFALAVRDDDLDDLRRRLQMTRFPNQLEDAGWDMGTDLHYLRELVNYWSERFDWRSQERRFARLDHHTTEIDGQRIHFAVKRSSQPGAFPLLLVHGWPGSFVEFLDAAELLGSKQLGQEPYDLVIPSLPGYAYSGPTTVSGWHPRRIAIAFIRLMEVSVHVPRTLCREESCK